MAKASFFNNSSSSDKQKQEKSTSTIIEEKQKTPVDPDNKTALPADSLMEKTPDRKEQWFFRRALWLILLTIALLLFTFAVGFFVTLQGAEKTMVPNVEKMDLVDGLIELQEKGLNSRVQVKYTQNPEEKGTIVSQNPGSGQNVRIGRKVTLTVSQGAIVENIGDYIGMTLDEVKLELQTIFASFQTLIEVGEVVYQYSDEPEGVIIAQDPTEGTEVTGLTPLNLVVSRGMQEGLFKVENFTGMNYGDVLTALAEQNIPFVFHIDESSPAQSESIVFRQVPAIGEMVEVGTPLELYINPLSERAIENSGDDRVFGLFEYQVPQFMVPIPMRAEKKTGTTEPVIIFEMQHSGGLISFPYLEEEGTSISLYANEKEIIRYYVQN